MAEGPSDPIRPIQVTALDPLSPVVSERVGNYRFLSRIGEGGMGEVWMAEQVEPVRRRVAIKVIKAGMDSRKVVARFEAERQALALMNHPAIATVYDGGLTREGRPYFVMELVHGEPITTYCDRHRLSTEQRLALFISVCEGVQHAHQKGLIHRDLKPSNVLVMLQGERPAPKIIDFGVAKATAHQLGATLYTEQGALVGTPEYMSPEQAEMGPLDIDTRTDVYALGVMLYEILTGTLPLDRERLRRAGLAEIQRTIREEEAPRPSTRVTRGGALSSEAARNRGLDPARLASRLRGDLDWITMKALQKDRTMRYDTAIGFASDLRRHLENEPVLAGPPSQVYRARKFVRRHRAGVVASAAIALLLVAFAAATAVQAGRIARERDRANREAARAATETAAAVQVADFLAGLFRVSDPAEARGRAMTAREILDKGAARVGTDLAREPLLQARLLFTLGDVYRTLGAVDRADQLLQQSAEIYQRAAGPAAPDTLRTESLLGSVYDVEGKTDLAERTLASVLASQRRMLGENHPDTLKTFMRLANLYDSQGRYEKSVPMMQDVLERRRRVMGVDHMDTLGSEYNAAIGFYRTARFADAERLLIDVAQRFGRVAGANHPQTLMAKDLLATVYLEMERPRDAGRILNEVYAARLRILGPTHTETLGTQLGLANVALKERRFADAERLYRDTLRVQEQVEGPDHRDAIATRASLATMLSDAGRFDESEQLWRDTLARMQRTLGAGHPDLANCFAGLAAIALHRGQRGVAIGFVRDAIRVNPLWAHKLAAEPEFASIADDPDVQRAVATAKPK